MKLHVLNRLATGQPHDGHTRSPHILCAIDTLNAIWSGEFDDANTAAALRRTAKRLSTLAETILTHA